MDILIVRFRHWMPVARASGTGAEGTVTNCTLRAAIFHNRFGDRPRAGGDPRASDDVAG